MTVLPLSTQQLAAAAAFLTTLPAALAAGHAGLGLCRPARTGCPARILWSAVPRPRGAPPAVRPASFWGLTRLPDPAPSDPAVWTCQLETTDRTGLVSFLWASPQEFSLVVAQPAPDAAPDLAVLGLDRCCLETTRDHRDGVVEVRFTAPVAGISLGRCHPDGHGFSWSAAAGDVVPEPPHEEIHD